MENVKTAFIGIIITGVIAFIAWLRHTIKELDSVKSELTKEQLNATTKIQEQKVSDAAARATISLDRYEALKRERNNNKPE